MIRFVILLVMLVHVCGCKIHEPLQATETNEVIGIWECDRISTITYDGHRFIVYRGPNTVAMIRHPDDK